jgi:uncharacterized protein YqgQ
LAHSVCLFKLFPNLTNIFNLLDRLLKNKVLEREQFLRCTLFW